MSLSEGDLQYIGQYVRAELPGWLRDLGPWAFGSQLMERMVRIEEELKAQRELLLAHVEASDRPPTFRRYRPPFRRHQQAFRRCQQPLRGREQAVRRREQAVRGREQTVDDNNRRHSTTQWFVGAGFLVVTTLISLYQFLG